MTLDRCRKMQKVCCLEIGEELCVHFATCHTPCFCIRANKGWFDVPGYGAGIRACEAAGQWVQDLANLTQWIDIYDIATIGFAKRWLIGWLIYWFGRLNFHETWAVSINLQMSSASFWTECFAYLDFVWVPWSCLMSHKSEAIALQLLCDMEQQNLSMASSITAAMLVCSRAGRWQEVLG